VKDRAALWTRATRWPAFLRAGMDHYDLWRGIYDHVVLPGWAIEGFMRSPARKLMVIAADWCGDAANTVPVLARLADLVRGMELRILVRDEHPEVMNEFLTNGTRSIPIAIVLDESNRELGHWGPRPAALQEWVLAHKKLMPSPQRYAYARQWYARDKGETTLRELLAAVSGRPPA
jgi:thioredoxin-like negative regulator of GroEL